MPVCPREERITLNSYRPAFEVPGCILLFPLQVATAVRLTVGFDNGYARWAVNGAVIHSIAPHKVGAW